VLQGHDDTVNAMDQRAHRQGVSPEMAVALAVADNRLEGFETPPDLMEMLLRVAKGEISADDAVRERLGVLRRRWRRESDSDTMDLAAAQAMEHDVAPRARHRGIPTLNS
jgi:hypothetical protein